LDEVGDLHQRRCMAKLGLNNSFDF
jgi:hypothetical protein